MSFKCGMPIIKTNNGHYSSNSTTHGNLGAVACEAGEERWCSDPDLDRTKTHENIYLTDITSGLEFEALVNAEIDALSEEMKLTSKNHRGLRKDCIRGFAGIVKPDEEFMSQLTEEQQEQFLRDALEVLNGYFGTNPKTNQPNIRFAVIHKDEKVMHLHYQGIPYNSEGRLCADDIFKPKLYKWLNEGFVDEMRQKGWDLEKCVKEQDLDSPYDDVKYKQLRKDAKTAKKELEKAIAGGDETTIATAQAVYDEKHREYDDYKKICVDYKRNKRKEHGKASKEFKEQQDRKQARDSGYKMGRDLGFNVGEQMGYDKAYADVKDAVGMAVEDAYKEAYETAYKEATEVYKAEMEKRLKSAFIDVRNDVIDKVDDILTYSAAAVEEYEKAYEAHKTAEQTTEAAELRETLKSIVFSNGKTGLDKHEFRMAKKAEIAEKQRLEAQEKLKQRQEEIQRLELLSETDGLTDQQQNYLNGLYKQRTLSGAQQLLGKDPSQYSAYQNKVLNNAYAKIEAERKRQEKQHGIGQDIGN